MNKNIKINALKAAFPYTLPILTAFGFLGLAYGIYMESAGFSFVYPMLMSLLIFGGSLEFVAVEMLLSPFAPVQVILVALLIQARHLFYGLAMLRPYRNLGLKKYYMIFGLCDESFSINYSAVIPSTVDRGWFMFFVTLLNHCYWVLGATLGGLFGTVLNLNIEGIDFVMPAMFTVIFIEQWKKEKVRTPAFIGFLASVGCLLIFGPDSFMVPTMLVILVVLVLLRKPLEQRGGLLK